MALRNPRLSLHVHDIAKRKVVKTDLEPLSQYLWEQTESTRQKALATYFVQGVGKGNLNPTAFGGFMVQDSVYCYKAKGSIDVAASRAQEGDLKAYLQKESGSYESYYQDLFTKWHIKDATGIDLDPACQSYAEYEHLVASTKDTIYMIVAMIPCMKLWPWLGQQLQTFNHGVYTDWYNANFDPTYDGYKQLDEFVDTAGTTIDKETALKVYSRCMEGEYEFFNSAQLMM
ncbi:uncharacterized protein LOC110465552 [Mizuhopecten yessoensis]|uniref:Thiamine biosynthesis multifunctional protein ThiED n=1 Tax=Mizuhopecten yessoensis TaxID=6573 RepID=A0A210PRG6_MIZYE|nr:uncharacterized protein LOC110465552 [Mizuhopecten yessoensis]XP_021377141.1 uncharacterized protein LOC110465552 [Mizuhopecten yessoensis]XP_021377142.1 uncharacterized protein LOC110465552 [Mizuhopecten yessoensis]OWF39042.1 Thiamine biosynthesis multifunctional protein ThiED [Mizuhopecten yessoensis]